MFELTKHDEPFGALDTVVIGLGVTESLPLGLTGLINLGLGTVTDEDGLSTPLDDDLLEWLDKIVRKRNGWI